MVKLSKNRTEQLRDRELDVEAWQKLYYKYQQDYIPQRLFAIKYLYEGKSQLQTVRLIGCAYNTLKSWIARDIEGGLQKLCEPIRHYYCPPTS